jgi:hypothetical protein
MPQIIDLRENKKEVWNFIPTHSFNEVNGRWESINSNRNIWSDDNIWMSALSRIVRLTDNITVVFWASKEDIEMYGTKSIYKNL